MITSLQLFARLITTMTLIPGLQVQSFASFDVAERVLNALLIWIIIGTLRVIRVSNSFSDSTGKSKSGCTARF